MMRKVQVILILALSLLMFATPGRAAVSEKELLRNSPEFGDFRKAREIRERDKVSLKVWESYREFLGRQPSKVKSLMLSGPKALEVSYDEIWEKERDYDPTLVEQRETRGKPFLVKLYWLKGRVQAYTVERFCKTDPLVWENLDPPGYRLIALLDRKTMAPELARLEAQAQAFEVMASGAHLQEAQKALAAGNPDETDLKKRTYGRLEDARRHLEAIDRNADGYDVAQKLLDEVERREKDLKRYKEAMRQAVREEGVKKREEAAKVLDRDFLSKGFDVKMELSGPDKTTIKMDCVVFSRPMVYVFVEKSDLMQNLRDAGFTEVVFANKNIKYEWDIDLNN